MTTLDESVGQRIAVMRTFHGRSQAELGEALEPYLGKPWSRQAVSAAEKGRRHFDVEELVAFASILDVGLFYLLTPTDDIEFPSGASMNADDIEKVLMRNAPETDHQKIIEDVQSFATSQSAILHDLIEAAARALAHQGTRQITTTSGEVIEVQDRPPEEPPETYLVPSGEGEPVEVPAEEVWPHRSRRVKEKETT